MQNTYKSIEELECPVADGKKIKLDMIISSDSCTDSNFDETLKGMGFSIVPENEEGDGEVGTVKITHSPKRVRGYLSVSIVKEKYIPSKHGLSDFVVYPKTNVSCSMTTIVRNYARDALNNMIFREKVINGLTRIMQRIDPNVLNEKLLSKVLMETVEKQLEKYKTLNIQDLKHQTMFFLSTMSLKDIFLNSSRFTINMKGEFSGERPIVSQSTVDYSINEQRKVVENYIRGAPDFVMKVLEKKGIFSDDRWKLIKKGNETYCHDGSDNIPVHLKKIPIEYAMEIHERLHYVHAARGDITYGLFLDGEDVPFSVLSVEKGIDRGYKEEALLLAGYNPSACFEYARLFSRPGTPMNTSSFMLSVVRDKLKEEYPSIQAIITSFMPAYASGKSMICSGFNQCLFAKRLSHKFYYENELLVHHVKRRQNGNPVRRSIMPLHPTLYLICKIREPRKNFWTLPSESMPYYSNAE